MTTITREQFLTISGCESSHELARKLEQIGITIAPPEPPEGMVTLAVRGGASWEGRRHGSLSDYEQGYLAALQFAADAVAEHFDGVKKGSIAEADRNTIRRKLGAIK